MKRVFPVYIIAYLILLAVVLGLLIVYPKPELHLLLNSYHTDVLDFFFKYYSTFAEWALYVLALLPLLWKRKELTIFFAASELTSAAVIRIIKLIVSAPRPITYFEENFPDVVLPLVEGVKMHHSNSFPSGHTSTFFVFFTCCALLVAYQYKQKAQQNDWKRWTLTSLMMVGMLILAALGGYSRIYLSQHFTMDVFVGSIVGFITTCLMFYFGRKKILKLKD